MGCSGVTTGSGGAGFFVCRGGSARLLAGGTAESGDGDVAGAGANGGSSMAAGVVGGAAAGGCASGSGSGGNGT